MLNIELEHQAKIYSKALFELADSKNIADTVYNDLQNLALTLNFTNADSLYKKLQKLNKTNQKKFFNNIFLQLQTSNHLQSFFSLMLLNGKLHAFLYFVFNYNSFLYMHKGYTKILVTSAVELTENQKQKLQDSLKQKLKYNFYTDYKVNKSILGGLIVKTKGQVFDDSVKTKIQGMVNQLIKV